MPTTFSPCLPLGLYHGHLCHRFFDDGFLPPTLRIVQLRTSPDNGSLLLPAASFDELDAKGWTRARVFLIELGRKSQMEKKTVDGLSLRCTKQQKQSHGAKRSSWFDSVSILIDFDMMISFSVHGGSRSRMSYQNMSLVLVRLKTDFSNHEQIPTIVTPDETDALAIFFRSSFKAEGERRMAAAKLLLFFHTLLLALLGHIDSGSQFNKIEQLNMPLLL
ncbi:hypothetical protein HPP92_016945 [Vanilla planifolia]|uniref:Uncharacterized protein n=1 Tax=Vanilla planifolia TaxID=51239 RepID=A0A835QH24_VANPL|nr:hypothetical protein HPP92_017529 [Vanilla planifolia]KAG0472399.1 hypothetical protein HPP92_016945 [Vanilla planifolia]